MSRLAREAANAAVDTANAHFGDMPTDHQASERLVKRAISQIYAQGITAYLLADSRSVERSVG